MYHFLLVYNTIQ